MKVLIVTYYWPPAGGSGVQRWLQFVKYLRDFGIEPIVYTVANPEYVIEDASLEKHIPEGITVLTQPIREPLSLLKILTKKSAKQSSGFIQHNPTFFQRLMLYIRANWFVPDARKFWIRPSVKYLVDYLQSNSVDAIISTGPPHSLHLIGQQVKKATGLPWIADFRDPWIEIDYFHQLPHTAKTIAKHRAMEAEVAKKADALVVVGRTMHAYYSQLAKPVFTITNGYDTDAYASHECSLDTRFTLTHIGMMNADRNPKNFWNVLRELCEESPSFKNDLQVQLIGSLADEVSQEIAQFPKETIVCLGYLSHDEVLTYQQQSQVLLLCINQVPSAKGIVTGKLFEYIQAKRPILAIGPIDGDAAAIIEDTESGCIVDFNDSDGLKKAIWEYYELYREQNLMVNPKNIEQYHRKALTKSLAAVIHSVVRTS